MIDWIADWAPLLVMAFMAFTARAKGFDSNSDWMDCKHCNTYFACLTIFTLVCLSPFIYVFLIKPLIWLLTLLA
jgi:hypothetical protein